MKAHYGYKNGSGDYFIVVDTDLCNGCQECVKACPKKVLELVADEFDLDGDVMMAVKEEHRRKIKYSCAPCKPIGNKSEAPCILACEAKAITHSW